jgi:hypothetical protein
MKAFSESPSAHANGAGLILLFDGEVAAGRGNQDCRGKQPDEHSAIGILTSGMNLAPAFPIKL